MPETVSDTLNTAADLIETHGWTKGTAGWPGYGGGSKLCIEGGIIAALGGTFQSIRRDDLTDCPAYRAVERYTETPRSDEGKGRLFRFNDANGRTAVEVVATLRAVALIEAARDDAELLAECGR